METPHPKFVNAKRLLEELFEESSRPSIRTLWHWKATRAIPFTKVRNMVFFDVDAVRAALASRHTIRAKGAQ